MDEDLVHIHNGISLSHKKNDFQSVFSEVDEPRAVIQSEVRQKEKKKNIVFSSVAQSCPTLCDPMDCSMPGLSVHHRLLGFTQTHVH